LLSARKSQRKKWGLSRAKAKSFSYKQLHYAEKVFATLDSTQANDSRTATPDGRKEQTHAAPLSNRNANADASDGGSPRRAASRPTERGGAVFASRVRAHARYLTLSTQVEHASI
jgi:hypothetical protein